MNIDVWLQEMEEICNKATPPPWGPYNTNLPFYSIVKKPAPSLSKHDSEQETFWRMEDAAFIAVARRNFPKALAYIKELKRKLYKE